MINYKILKKGTPALVLGDLHKGENRITVLL